MPAIMRISSAPSGVSASFSACFSSVPFSSSMLSSPSNSSTPGMEKMTGFSCSLRLNRSARASCAECGIYFFLFLFLCIKEFVSQLKRHVLRNHLVHIVLDIAIHRIAEAFIPIAGWKLEAHYQIITRYQTLRTSDGEPERAILQRT